MASAMEREPEGNDVAPANIALNAREDTSPPKDRSPLPLAPELIHQVFSHLTTNQVGSSRLASRTFADMGKEYMVKELYFFMHPSSIQKVIQISESNEWAPKVKTIVFENVARPGWNKILSKSESESGSTKFSKGSNPWMNKLSNSLQPTRYHYHLTQVSSCVKTFGIFLESALPKFHSLRAVFAHEEFHDERPHGPDADNDLGQVCWPLRHSVEKPDLANWADRDSLRMFGSLQDFEGQIYTGQYIDFCFDRFLGMWERCLEVAN